MIEVLRSKIHRAVVTDANLNYEGSITIYKGLMEASWISEYEKVTVVNINNGARFETYVIQGEDKNNAICLNGAAARLVSVADKVIIMAYRFIDEEDLLPTYKPTIVVVNDDNEIIS